MVQAINNEYPCTVLINGQPSSSDNLDGAHLKELALTHGRRAVLDVSRTTPYKCIGGVVFYLQRAGFKRIAVRVDGVET